MALLPNQTDVSLVALIQDLFGSVTCALDVAIQAYYLIGLVHFNLKDYKVAERIFKGSLAVLQQLSRCGREQMMAFFLSRFSFLFLKSL